MENRDFLEQMILKIDPEIDDAGLEMMVSDAKLKSRGVPSVRARVLNLRELCPDICTDRLKGAILEAFGEVYGLTPKKTGTDFGKKEDIIREAGELASESWLFPVRLPFTDVVEGCYAWGGIRIELLVRGNRIAQASCFSDAMEEGLIRRIGEGLAGCRYDSGEIAARVLEIAAESQGDKDRELRTCEIGENIAELIRGKFL